MLLIKALEEIIFNHLHNCAENCDGYLSSHSVSILNNDPERNKLNT